MMISGALFRPKSMAPELKDFLFNLKTPKRGWNVGWIGTCQKALFKSSENSMLKMT